MTAPDARTTLHDHPWSFLSIVLRGGYVERRLDPRHLTINEAHHVRRFNRVRPWDAHAIGAIYPTPMVMLREAANVLVDGGKIGFLHHLVPMLPPELERIGTWGVHCGAQTRIRAFTIARRRARGAL